MGIATVYRALREFVDEGWLTTITIAGNARYELAHLDHHHHFYCEQCTRTFDIDGCSGDPSRLLPDGFTMRSHELTLHGTCSKCAITPNG